MIPLPFHIAGSGGNATVPDDAPILPHQAFVDTIATFTSGNGVELGDVTFLSPDLAAASVVVQQKVRASVDFDLSGGELVAENIDDLLAAMAGVATANSVHTATLYLYGGNMGKPTPAVAAVAHEDGDVTLDFSGLVLTHERFSAEVNQPAGGLLLNATNADGTFSFQLNADSAADFSASSTTTGSVTVGIQDNPAWSDVRDKFLELMSGVLAGSSANFNAGTGTTIDFDVGPQKWTLSGIGVTETQVGGLGATGGTLPIMGATWSGPTPLLFDLALPGSGSSYTGGNLIIGLADATTADDVAAALAGISTTDGGVTLNLIGSSHVQCLAHDDDVFPLGNFTPDTVPSITQSAQSAGTKGVVEVINADLASLIGGGWHGDYKATDGTQTTF